MKALIITGLQVDLLPLGAAEVKGSERLVPAINQLMEDFEVVVAAQFSHPASHKMFVANYPWRRPGQEIDLAGDKVMLRNYYCVNGTFGAEPAMGLLKDKIAKTVQMGTHQRFMPHSAFYDENKVIDTGLRSFLSQNNINEIYLAGQLLEPTIANSALDGLALGLKVHLFEDAVCEFDKKVLASLKDKGVQMVLGESLR